MTLNGRKLYIADTAAVILPQHRQSEMQDIKSGSTFSGAGAALVDKVMRKSPLVGGDERFLELEKQGLIQIVSSKTFFPMLYSGFGPFKGNENILVELSQGDALSLNNSANYPFTTSRDCSPAQALKDIHASGRGFDVKKYCVFRPYPIRINNNSDAGYIYTGDFDGANEITWKEVCLRSGLNVVEIEKLEHTTVTKRLRRVSEFCIKQFAEMLLDTCPDECFVNFAQYVNGNIAHLTNAQAKQIQKDFLRWEYFSDEEIESVANKNFAIENVFGYIENIEEFFNDLLGGKFLTITKIGTGAKLSETIDRKSICQAADNRHAINNINPLDYSDKTNLPHFEIQ